MNLAFFITESALHYLPSIWIAFAVVFFEGLLGGTAFVNTFYRIIQEVRFGQGEGGGGRKR